MVLRIRAIEFDDNGNIVKAKGDFVKSNIWFTKITDKVMYWAEIEIDYAGG